MNPNAVQLRAALVGDFDREVQGGLKDVEVALRASLFDFADDLQSKWRQDVRQSGLANAEKLTKTIRVRRYPNKGLNPAAVVFSTFPIIQKAFEQSVTIRSQEGFFLPIPNPDVWPTGRVIRWGRRGAPRQSSIAVAEARFGPLRFVYRPGRASLLVAEVRASAARPGTYRKASASALRTGNGLITVVVFFLVREARTPRMLRGSVIRARALRDAPGAVDRRFVHYFENGGGQRLLTGPSHD